MYSPKKLTESLDRELSNDENTVKSDHEQSIENGILNKTTHQLSDYNQPHPTKSDSDNSNNSNIKLGVHAVSTGRVKLVAKLLVDMKTGLMEDLNYSRDIPKNYEGLAISENNNNNNTNNSVYDEATRGTSNANDSNKYSNIYLGLIPMDEQQEVPKVSKATRLRSERVRIYLDYYYNNLEGTVNMVYDESGENLHKNVEGVYNPLQMIRNRKLRKKYQDEISVNRFLFYKSPVVAILQFSKISDRKKYRWFVDVNEKFSDLAWRVAHWDELKDPRGNLWFDTKQIHKHSHLRGTLHQSRKKSNRDSVGESIGNSGAIGSNIKEGYNTSLDVPAGLKLESSNSANSANKIASDIEREDGSDFEEMAYKNDKTKNKSHSHRFEKIIKKTKNASKKLSRSPVKQGQDDSFSDESSQLNKKGDLIPPKLCLNEDSIHIKSSDSGSNTYATPIEPANNQRLSLLNDIPIQKLKNNPQKKSLEALKTSKSASKNNSSTDGSFISTDMDNQSNDMSISSEEKVTPNDKGDFTKKATKGSQNQLTVSGKEKSPDSMDSNAGYDELPIDSQLHKYWQDTRYIVSTIAIMEHRRQTHELIRKRAILARNKTKIDHDTDKNMTETENIITEYNEELDKVLKLGNNWTSKLLNDYSIRVETLISASDRILSDINTTLTLKLKLFQENTDRFGSLKTMQTQRMTKFTYRLLECFIVLILWSIWLAVSILREIKHSFLFVLRLIKWMVW